MKTLLLVLNLIITSLMFSSLLMFGCTGTKEVLVTLPAYEPSGKPRLLMSGKGYVTPATRTDFLKSEREYLLIWESVWEQVGMVNAHISSKGEMFPYIKLEEYGIK